MDAVYLNGHSTPHATSAAVKPCSNSIHAPACIFLLSGEGAHSADTDISGLKTSSTWKDVAASLLALGLIQAVEDVEAWLHDRLGVHSAPDSPVVTTAINILNADRWRAAGYQPDVAIGHSVGEVTAAYLGGMLDVEGALRTAHVLGQIGEKRAGAMAHTRLTRGEIDSWTHGELHIAAVNGASAAAGEEANLFSVTLSGAVHDVDEYLSKTSGAKKLMPPHPWHHPTYLSVPGVADSSAFAQLPRGQCCIHSSVFVSTVRTELIREIDPDYWRDWLTKPVDMAGALECAARLLGGRPVYTIETGAHPVLTPTAVATLERGRARMIASVISLRRGQPDALSSQLATLQAVLSPSVKSALSGLKTADLIPRIR